MNKKVVFTIELPKLKGRGKLPPPPSIQPNKIKKESKSACRKKIDKFQTNLDNI
jgi:hypothetical protein